jgi:hypothetical protein
MPIPELFNDNMAIELVKSGLNLAIGLVTLLLTWLVGQRVLSFWEAKKKRKELDIALVVQFQNLYGEYKIVWRLWKIFQASDHVFSSPDHTRWNLIERATRAEGSIEAMLLKLAVERELVHEEIRALGLFRQAYQSLREGILDSESLDYPWDSPEYLLFNELSIEVAHILEKSKPRAHLDV